MEGRPETDARTSEPLTRRRLLLRASAALASFAGFVVALPIVGFVVAAIFRRKPSRAWVSLGPLDEFPERETRLASYRNPFSTPLDGETAQVPCFVRRLDGERFQVFAVQCTHLGCPVRWFPEAGLFLCPCHGGAYHADGRRASGPPPRGLYEYAWRIEDGELFVRAGDLPTPSREP
ncbi:menaquinol-cytochrome c reductase iron-sulfur subunit [Myxococcaceae bacterium]|jgi:nitrite reductase/ring-hydroxylating ferredoxin subunit|nr:menaquinol-cytochrome c reductase iron-sulfur subunit [Myxococcaceae bacterium]